MKNQCFRSFGRSLALLVLVIVAAGVHSVFAESPDASTGVDQQAPAWATSANWYQLSVPLFRNGSKENDPPGTKPWTTTCDAKNVEKQEDGVHAGPPPLYGGDLQGLQERLNYLQRLGINALILTDVFSGTVVKGGRPIDVRHIDDSLGIKNSLGELDQTAKQTGDALTKTDKLFVAFLKEAHRAGFRVVLSAPWPAADETNAADASDRQSNAMAATRRWMDPNKDSDTSDGVDGWHIQTLSVADQPTLARWYQHVKKINVDAVVISGDGNGFDEAACDIFVNFPGAVISEFWTDLSGEFGSPSSQNLLTDAIHGQLSEAFKRLGRTASLTPTRMFPDPSRLYTQTVLSDNTYDKTSAPNTQSNQRYSGELMTVFLHLAGAAPLTYFGDEVGMHTVQQCVAMPMWWNDLSSASPPSEYRLDFYALTKLMNQLRSRFAALRRGGLSRIELPQPTVHDVLVFSRSLPDEEVIVVLNRGKHDRTILVPVGYPGQLVGVLAPQIQPGRVSPFAGRPQTIGGKPVPQLGIGAQRRHADEWGDVTLNLKPESVKLIVIGDVRR